MSEQTNQWLNTWIYIGQTEKRGDAWWRDKRFEEDGRQNHWPGFVPIEAVKEGLFNWEPIALTPTLNGVDHDDNPVRYVDTAKQVMFRPAGTLGDDDMGGPLGYFGTDSYKHHSFKEWLLTKVAHLFADSEDSLGITSAGLLRQGALAWVEVSVPETIETPEGVRFRPNLLAATSLDGSLASVYKRTITNTVCDNTMSAALSEASPTVRVRHTRYSELKIADSMQTLELIYSVKDQFSAQVAELCNTTVTDKQWGDFLGKLFPVPKDDGRAKTMAEDKQAILRRLYEADERCNPWQGTAYGVVQTVNTYYHHEQPIWKKTNRAERNQTRAVFNDIEKMDKKTLELLGV